MDDVSAQQVATPQPYTDFDRLPIGGGWRRGNSGHVLADRDPYTGQVILEIPQADRTDLDEAYSSAATAQVAWAAELAGTRAAVFRRAAEILEARREEVISWLIRESGSTRLKATLEWASTRGI